MPEDIQKPELEPTPAIRDKRASPEGVVPKQAQAYVIAGLAVLILMAVMFSKNHAKPAAKEAALPPAAVSNDMNQRKIQELEQDLTADQRQSEQQAETQRAGTAGVRQARRAASIRRSQVLPLLGLSCRHPW